MAKIRPEQLGAALKKNLAPVYLVCGDEPLLIQESSDAIRHTATKAGYSERELYHADTHFDWHYLLNAINSLSLFAEKKIIEVRVSNAKVDDSGAKVLLEYCDKAPNDIVLLLIFPKLDKKAQNSAWFKAVENCGHSIIIWPVGPQQLHRWIEQRLNAAGLSARSSAIEILCTKIEGNLLAAVQEIEKLKLLTRNGDIDSQLMTEVVMDSARYSIFGLIDKALEGDSRAAALNLRGLQGEGAAPPTVLWALTREIRILAAIKESMETGESFDLAARKSGVWDNRKSLIRNAVQKLKLQQLQTLIRMAGLADRTIKGLAKGDVWSIFLDMTLALTGTQTLSNKTRKLLLSL